MKKTFKMLNLMLAIITLLTTILPTTTQLSEVFAATAQITYNRCSRISVGQKLEILQ